MLLRINNLKRTVLSVVLIDVTVIGLAFLLGYFTGGL